MLPESAEDALLRMAEVLAAKGSVPRLPGKPQFGSAKGLIQIGLEFDEPLEDFKPYTE